MFSASPSGATSGTMRVEIVGEIAYTSSIHGIITHVFDSAGEFTIAGEYIPGAGAPIAENIQVTVLDAYFPESPACWIGVMRQWSVPDLSPLVTVNYDPRMLMAELDAGLEDQRIFRNLLYQPENHYMVARAGNQGPIITNAMLRGFRLGMNTDTEFRTLAVCTTGDQLVETIVVVSPPLEDLTFRGEIIVGGLIYENGSITNSWTIADFNELGEMSLRYLRSSYSETAWCALFDVYQGDSIIGRFNSND